MPVGDVVAEGAGAVLRVLGRILVEVVAEILIAGPRELLLRIFRPKTKRGRAACGYAGILFWLVVVAVAIGVYWATRGTA